MESLRNTKKLIHNTQASDLCQHRLALLYYFFLSRHIYFACLGVFVFGVHGEE